MKSAPEQAVEPEVIANGRVEPERNIENVIDEIAASTDSVVATDTSPEELAEFKADFGQKTPSEIDTEVSRCLRDIDWAYGEGWHLFGVADSTGRKAQARLAAIIESGLCKEERVDELARDFFNYHWWALPSDTHKLVAEIEFLENASEPDATRLWQLHDKLDRRMDAIRLRPFSDSERSVKSSQDGLDGSHNEIEAHSSGVLDEAASTDCPF